MDIEICIGRDVEGPNAYKVPETFKRVSRDHARLHWNDGIVTIEDHNSTNGTFVNGERITKKQITDEDIVWLGGLGTNDQCYRLDFNIAYALFQNANPARKTQAKVTPIDEIPTQAVNPVVEEVNPVEEVKPVAENRTDYTAEFASLKQTYIDYQKKLTKLKDDSNRHMQMSRLIPTMIPALLGILILIVSTDMTMRIVAMSLGSVMSGLIGTLTMGKSNSAKDKMAEDIMELQI